MDPSVIISVYNRPRFLELVLRGYAVQTDRNFEIVIADDGSGPEIRDVIARERERSGMPIVHVWHEDIGFRKSLALNRAIVAARTEYLLFTDGDCIPRRDLIAVHRGLARAGRYVAGGYLKVPAEVTAAITEEDVESGRATDLRWLRARGWRAGRRAFRVTRSPRLAALYDLLTPTRADFQGNNACAWRRDIIAVNGFEGEMGYGGLDQALGFRLTNAGIRGIQARHRAVAIHLHHERPYRDDEMIRRNVQLKQAIRARGYLRARLGIAELGPDPSLVITGDEALTDRR